MAKKKYIYKIKDLPKDFNLVGCKLGGREIVSGWSKGFWLGTKDSGRLIPVFFKSFEQIENWKVEVPIERSIQILKNA